MKRLSHLPASPVPAAIAVAGSVAVHLGVMSWHGMSPEVQVAGGGGAQVAVQGTSFADLTAGVSESVPVETTTAIVSQTQSQVVTQPAVISATVKPSVTATAMPTQPEVTSSTPTPTAPLPAVAPNMAPPVVASHTADNAVASVEETTPRISAPPRERSAEIEKQPQARTRGKPTPQRTTVSKPRGTAKKMLLAVQRRVKNRAKPRHRVRAPKKRLAMLLRQIIPVKSSGASRDNVCHVCGQKVWHGFRSASPGMAGLRRCGLQGRPDRRNWTAKHYA